MLFHDRLQGVRSNRGMGLHKDAFIRFEFARLQQNVVGQPHLANVVHGRTAYQKFDKVGINLPGKCWCLGCLFRQATGVVFHPSQAGAGFTFPKLDQLGKRLHQAIASVDQIGCY
jgi:hypothetical protein